MCNKFFLQYGSQEAQCSVFKGNFQPTDKKEAIEAISGVKKSTSSVY